MAVAYKFCPHCGKELKRRKDLEDSSWHAIADCEFCKIRFENTEGDRMGGSSDSVSERGFKESQPVAKYDLKLKGFHTMCACRCGQEISVRGNQQEIDTQLANAGWVEIDSGWYFPGHYPGRVLSQEEKDLWAKRQREIKEWFMQ